MRTPPTISCHSLVTTHSLGQCRSTHARTLSTDMGNTVPPRVPREATGGRRGAGTGRRRSENVAVTEAAPPATPSRVVGTARKQDGDVEEETTRAGRALRAGGGDGAAASGKVLAVRIVMERKDAEALVARLMKAQSARVRKARMAELRSELRAGSCSGEAARAETLGLGGTACSRR